MPPGELPADFARIPEKSSHAHVRAHVPGTVEAQEALLDNTIPQTQAIRRDAPPPKINYDGAPVFKDVESTTLQYAVNTPQAVFKLGKRYYACEQAVWYKGRLAHRPLDGLVLSAKGHLQYSGIEPASQRDVRQSLRGQATGGVRRLHAWVSGQLSLRRLRGVRHRLAVLGWVPGPRTTLGRQRGVSAPSTIPIMAGGLTSAGARAP